MTQECSEKENADFLFPSMAVSPSEKDTSINFSAVLILIDIYFLKTVYWVYLYCEGWPLGRKHRKQS